MNRLASLFVVGFILIAILPVRRMRKPPDAFFARYAQRTNHWDRRLVIPG
jgi:hypothetical protein